MTRHIYLLLFMAGLALAIGVATQQALPGYMDSDYYYAGGLQLVQGKGFTEPYLWNYLDDPAGLPHPSNTYWLPLSSILAAASMFVSGLHTYAGARLIFILITAIVPVVTARLAFDISGRRDLALTSGLLAVFSVYHAPFMPVTDNFAPFILLGGLIFLLANNECWWAFPVMGTLAGLMNLARSDGLLWLGLLGFLALWRAADRLKDSPATHGIQRAKHITFSVTRNFTLALLGYLLIMAPWYTRNFALFGSPMAPGGSRVVWLTNYNDTFAYPASQVNKEAWLAAGWDAALQARLGALKKNLLNAFGAQGGILLFPFILLGYWFVHNDIRARLAGVGWLLLFFVMTVIFPFAGARGGFFHAGVAFQPFWWAIAPLGLDGLVEVLRRRKIITAQHANAVFAGLLVFVSLILTGFILWLRVIQPDWQSEEEMYVRVEQFLIGQGATSDEFIIVRNPPGYYIVSGRPAITMPPGGPKTILALAARYHVVYFVLEEDGVLKEYEQLYQQYDQQAGFDFLGEVDGARIYALRSPE